MTVPLVRKRARRPKVRTGCRTCRARHVKCGEEKPVCWNCEFAGRECAGYDVVKPPVRPRLPLLQSQGDHPSAALLSVLTYCLPVLPGGIRSRDGYALDYFLQCALQDLPGSSWTLSWDRLILPYWRSEPEILYAVMAIGSLQQAADVNDGTNASFHPDQLTTALSQYGRAATMVRTAIEKHGQSEAGFDVESILTACLMLFCFEVLHGQDEHAAMHLRSGLKILYEHTGPPKGKTLQVSHHRPIEVQISARSRLELLTHTFVRLDSDMSQLSDRDSFLSPVSGAPVPASFDSLDEAMVHVDVLQSRVCDVGCQLDELAKAELSTTYPDFDNVDEDLKDVLVLAASRRVSTQGCPGLSFRMEETKAAMGNLMAALATLPIKPGQPDPHRMLVEIHFFLVWFDAAVWRDADEMEMDRFDQQFEYILSLCEQYFASNCHRQQQQAHTRSARPGFVIGTSVGQTVCLVVEKSRNSLLRRRGLKLLSGMDMRGAYDGDFLASFYQHVVETEELLAREILGLPEGHVFRFSEIPAAARFIEVDVAGIEVCDDLYYKKEVGRMIYARLVDGELMGGDYLFPVMRPFVVD
ncbi:hypothetical protein M409DRAFT_71618 [Zasmidium cellare ATCC 36951]|uniref:Zn(2)-C6 fungal-type domain-containing protein n=1 Tax=Zasmidium cellare ATCC 36951 TaxID=1080233 RepID=A0A6A6BX27_ZASCE|nr:uncharacterized protein M409DRAFT_71618 [Zasmidium cellare ATCC 36951]KAF2158500.1 hypothetical protein M409DRAFT_71618 [Zasmidium cellare ATCC 36951]